MGLAAACTENNQSLSSGPERLGGGEAHQLHFGRIGGRIWH